MFLSHMDVSHPLFLLSFLLSRDKQIKIFFKKIITFPASCFCDFKENAKVVHLGC